jgi:hypothetical protein
MNATGFFFGNSAITSTEVITDYLHGDGSNITGMVEPYAYLIFLDGTTVKAKNGSTGLIEFSGSSLVISTVLNNAINATYAKGGGKIFVKASNSGYLATSPIVLKSDVSLYGDVSGDHYGKGTLIYKYWNGTDYLIDFNTTLLNSNNIIEGFQFTLPTDFTGNGVFIRSTRFNIFKDNTVQNFEIGLRILEMNHVNGAGENNLIENNRFVFNTNESIVIDSTDQRISHNIVNMLYNKAGKHGIIENGSSNRIYGNHIQNLASGVDNTTFCIRSKIGKGYSQFYENYCDNTGGMLMESPYNIINNNRFYNTSTAPILLSGANFNIVSNNAIFDWSSLTPAGYSGITLVNSYNNSVMGNTFRANTWAVNAAILESTSGNNTYIGNVIQGGITKFSALGTGSEQVYNH